MLLTNIFYRRSDRASCPVLTMRPPSCTDHAGIVIVHDKTRPATEIASEILRIVAAHSRQTALGGFKSAEDWSGE